MLEPSEKIIEEKIKALKEKAGSHSPSIFSLAADIKEIDIKIDACFLSNPYATDLFLEYLNKDLIKTGELHKVLEYYPSQNRAVAEVLTPTLQVPAENIFIGNGASEIIQAVIQNFCKKKILINLPTFSPYYEFAKGSKEVVYNILRKENDFELNIPEFLEKVHREKPDTVVFINPNNPNGGYIAKKDIEYLINSMPDVEQVLLDESFIHFSYEDDELSSITYSSYYKTFPKVVIIKSMSKDFGIAGIRAGYAIMSKEKVDHLLQNGYLWNIGGLAEYFFRLLADQEFIAKYESVRKRYIEETKEFYEMLRKINGIKVYPSKANFYLVELPDGQNADEAALKLLIRYGVYCRSCSDKIGLEGEFLRLASRTAQENRIIADALEKSLQTRKGH